MSLKFVIFVGIYFVVVVFINNLVLIVISVITFVVIVISVTFVAVLMTVITFVIDDFVGAVVAPICCYVLTYSVLPFLSRLSSITLTNFLWIYFDVFRSSFNNCTLVYVLL